MFVILTSKLDEFNAQPEAGLTIIKSYEYFFYKKKKAIFNIARIDSDVARVSVIEAGENGSRNSIPIKLFESFESLDMAEKELAHLTSSNIMEVCLRQVVVN